METWEEEIQNLEEEIKELEMKFDHPHFMNSPENDYDVKSKIIEKQSQIIAIYQRESRKIVREHLYHIPKKK